MLPCIPKKRNLRRIYGITIKRKQWIKLRTFYILVFLIRACWKQHCVFTHLSPSQLRKPFQKSFKISIFFLRQISLPRLRNELFSQPQPDPKSKPETFGRPGHINPLYAQEKGVLRRAGHTEACVDMCRLAGLYPAAALMEIMNDDGTMARLPELREMADKYDIKLISIADLIAYRLKEESIVEKGEEVDMPTQYGHFRLIPFRQKSNGLEHVALIKGDLKGAEPVLVRVHSSCATGDIFGSLRCDCGDQLHKALQMVEKEGRGAVIYLNQEGRGIGLMEKMRAYKLQENGMDTVDANICLGHQADERDYGVGAQILRHLGITKMRLMTNNPVKRVGLEAYGLTVVENIPIEVEPNPYNEFYMKTKKERMGHILHNIK